MIDSEKQELDLLTEIIDLLFGGDLLGSKLLEQYFFLSGKLFASPAFGGIVGVSAGGIGGMSIGVGGVGAVLSGGPGSPSWVGGAGGGAGGCAIAHVGPTGVIGSLSVTNGGTGYGGSIVLPSVTTGTVITVVNNDFSVNDCIAI